MHTINFVINYKKGCLQFAYLYSLIHSSFLENPGTSAGSSKRLTSFSSSDSSAMVVGGVFWQVFPWQTLQRTEHLSPALRQEQVPPPHPFLHPQERNFNSVSGAGSFVEVTGINPCWLFVHPQLVGSFSIPNHFCTWW